MSQDPASNLLFNQVKAGIKVDPQKMAERIKELSKDTKYFEFQKKRTKNIDAQIQQYQEKLKRATPFDMREARVRADKYLADIEAKRDFARTYFHADLDAFYAAVEALDDPSLIGTAYAVGGEVKHGVISTSSYEARKSGIRAGMAVFLALQLCPGLKIIDAHMDRYKYFSGIVRGILARYDPNYFGFGLDEAMLDMTDYLTATQSDPRDVAKEIQDAVTKATRLTVSIGIAPTPQLAKIASDANKPNGYFMIEPNKAAVEDFLRDMPIRKIPGVGGARERLLQAFGMEKVCDVLEKKDLIFYLFSEKFIEFLIPSCKGIMVVPPRDPKTPQKSFSKEETFDATRDFEKLKLVVNRMSGILSGELKKRHVLCWNVGLRLKLDDFTTEGVSMTLKNATSDSQEIEVMGLKLLKKYLNEKDVKLRLLGLKVSQLTPDDGTSQRKLKDMLLAPPKKRKESEAAVQDVIDSSSGTSEDELMDQSTRWEGLDDGQNVIGEQLPRAREGAIDKWVVPGKPIEPKERPIHLSDEEVIEVCQEKPREGLLDRWVVPGKPIEPKEHPIPTPDKEVCQDKPQEGAIDKWVVPGKLIPPKERAISIPEEVTEVCQGKPQEGAIDKWVVPGRLIQPKEHPIPLSDEEVIEVCQEKPREGLLDRWVVPGKPIEPKPKRDSFDDRYIVNSGQSRETGAIDRWVVPGQMPLNDKKPLPTVPIDKSQDSICRWTVPGQIQPPPNKRTGLDKWTLKHKKKL